MIVDLLPAVSLSAVRFQLYAFCETALLIASATFLASAMPVVAAAVPLLTLIFWTFPEMLTVLPLALVVM